MGNRRTITIGLLQAQALIGANTILQNAQQALRNATQGVQSVLAAIRKEHEIPAEVLVHQVLGNRYLEVSDPEPELDIVVPEEDPSGGSLAEALLSAAREREEEHGDAGYARELAEAAEANAQESDEEVQRQFDEAAREAEEEAEDSAGRAQRLLDPDPETQNPPMPKKAWNGGSHL